MLVGTLRWELPRGVTVLRPEELRATRQHEIRVFLPATQLWWHAKARRRDAVGCQEGADQALGWEDRRPGGPEGLSELARRAGAGSPRRPACPGRPSPPLLPPAPPPLLAPVASFQRGFPGGHPPCFHIAPFGVILSVNSYTFLPAHAVRVPDLHCLCPRSPSPAVLFGWVFRRAVLSLRAQPA